MNKPLLKIERKTSVVNCYQLSHGVREFFKSQIHTYRWNKERDRIEDCGDYVYIGRPSRWGNPYQVTPTTPRHEAIEKFRQDAYAPDRKEFRNDVRRLLKGKLLVCYCFPSACHGDILAEIAESPMEE